MNGTLRCSDFFLLPQIMGLGLVFLSYFILLLRVHYWSASVRVIIFSVS